LGDGTYGGSLGCSYLPEQIVASNVAAIAAGWHHSLFVKNDGSLWAMGANLSGQLGDGTYNQTNRPKQIVASNVTAIAAGYFHSLFLKSDGSLWAMGNNASGQLGDGTYNDTNRPEQIVASNVTAIAAGNSFSLFLKSNGSLWAMGDNGSGQLGDGTYDQANVPEQIVAGSNLPPGYNQITARLLNGGKVRLSFVGLAFTNYALDCSYKLSPTNSANWLPQVTNPAASDGTLVITNTPSPATNYFWRFRSVP
jgi:hypothetical protein